MWKLREYQQAAAIFILMIILFFWPLLSGRILSQADMLYFFSPWSAFKPPDLVTPSNPVLNDQTREFLTFFHVARESLGQYQFPLWNPYIMAGTPLLANSQSAILFPLNWPFYFLPLYLGFTVSALLKMFIASFAAYAFARKISISHPGAILTGTIYAFSIFNVFWLNHPHTNVTIFFPLLLLLAEKIKEEPVFPSMAMMGLVVGLQFLGGHVEIAFHIALAVTSFFLFRLIEYRKDRKGLFLRLKIFIGGYTLGFFLAGVLMIPFLEFLSQSATWHVRSAKNPFFLDPIGLISLFLSDFFIKTSWSIDLYGYHSISLYTGICPLLIAIAGLGCRPHRISVFFTGFSLFALLIVFGVPPFFSLFTFLPLFKQIPNYYMVLFYVMSISLLAGMGFDLMGGLGKDEVLCRKFKKILMMTSFILTLLVVSVVLLAAKASMLSPFIKGGEALSVSGLGRILSEIGGNLFRSLFFTGLTFLFLGISCLAHQRKGLLGILVIGITYMDLFIAGAGWNPAIPIHWAKFSLPPSVQFLKGDNEIYRIASISPVMPPNLASFCGLQDIRGYDVPVGDRYHNFFQKTLKGKVEWWAYDLSTFYDEALDFLSLLNVKYILSIEPLPSPLLLIYDKEVKIYRNPYTFPRAFMVHQIESVKDGSEALARVIALSPELNRVGIIEGSPPDLFKSIPMAANEPGGEDQVKIIKYRTRKVEVDVETSAPGLLILSDTYFPGWKAYMDGKGVPIFRVNYLIKGVFVEHGNHRIVFVYVPLSFYIGLGLTVISGVIILWCLRKKRRSFKTKKQEM